MHLLERFAHHVRQQNWLGIEDDLETLLATISIESSLELCLHQARNFLPLAEYYLPTHTWMRHTLQLIEKDMSTSDIMLARIPRNAFNTDVTLSLESFSDGLNFLLIAYKNRSDSDIFLRKISIALQHFVSASIAEFAGARYPRQWTLVKVQGMVERHVSKLDDPVRRYQQSLWWNVFDYIARFQT